MRLLPLRLLIKFLFFLLPMAGFSLGYGRSAAATQYADPLLPSPPNRRASILTLALLLAFLGLAFTCISPWRFSFLPTPLISQEAQLTASCISHTRFPQLCISSLSSSPFLTSSDHHASPISIAALATQEAASSIHGFHILCSSTNLTFQNAKARAALSDCNEVLARSHDHLLLALQDLHSSEELSKVKVNDIRSWLSASLAFHTTCSDGLLALENEALSGLIFNAEKTAKLISNALAFATSLYKEAASSEQDWPFPLTQKLRFKGLNNAFPAWISEEDVALLQAVTPTPDVTVAADGSGKYKSVQVAVNAAPKKSSKRYVIYIKKGVYNEQVDVPKSATNLMFIGDGIGATVITGDKNVQQPDVTTFKSATVAINGAGFLARDITFQNTAGAIKHQAVALRVSADKTAFYKCSMEAYQDTLYAHSLRQFYRECDVYGTVDYIFGDSAAVLQNCRLFARVPMKSQKNTITAQGRTDPNANTGLSFQSCTVDGTPDLVKAISQFPTYLGRPWKEYSRTVFLKSYESGVVHPEGWLPWDGDFALKTLFYGEYLCTGPGAAAAKRVSWSTQIKTASVANQFTVANFIDGTNWLPSTSFPYEANL